jgi:hypothetical protein
VDKIISLLTPSLDFIKTNFGKIAVFFFSALGLYLGYLITTYSLSRLKSEVISYYPFDKFFPKSGRWSVVYFIITIGLLGLLIFIITRGGFYLAPA